MPAYMFGLQTALHAAPCATCNVLLRLQAFDSDGNLYFTDISNHTVFRLDTITGVATQVAGSGVSGAIELRITYCTVELQENCTS